MGKGCNFIFNIWAWIWNHFWGTLFLFAGVWGLFNGFEWWMCLLSVAVGVYFYMSSRTEAKIEKAVGNAVVSAATAVTAEVNKEHNAQIDAEAATPDEIVTTAPEADVLAALDAILSPTWFDSYHGRGLKQAQRTGETIAYVFGTKTVPEAIKAEVRVAAFEGGTRVSFCCLHQDGSNGRRSFADLVLRLRESVEYAVAAAGDPEKVAEGVKLYGPPAPGSPAAIEARNVKILMFVGAFICLVPLFRLKGGFPAGELPLWIFVEVIGLAVYFGTDRWAKRRVAHRAASDVAHVPAQVIAVASQASAAGKTLKTGAVAARSWFLGLSTKQRALVVVVAAALLIGAGIASTGARPNDGMATTSDGVPYEASAVNPADPATTDGSTGNEVTTNAAPMSAADAQAVIDKASTLEDLLSTYGGTGLDDIQVYWVGRVMEAHRTLVFNDGEDKQWAIPFDKVQGGFYIDAQECSEQEFYDMVISGHVMPGSVGFDRRQLWSVEVSTQ